MDQFYEAPDGRLFAANGFNAPISWDGLAQQMQTIGVIAPLTAPTLSGSGVGNIVGTYQAYLRFIDKDGLPSNLSPVSADYSASGSVGLVANATNTTPIYITTSASHGLTSGNLVKIEGVGGNTGANNTWTITVIDGTTFYLNDSSGTADYTGGGTWTSGISTITYSNVQTPTEAKIARRQLLRNTDGQSTTYYVDVDTTNLSASSFTSTRSDSELVTQESQAILDTSGNILANRHGLPPNHKQVFCALLDRMFLAVQEDYSRGSIKVTFGSPTVTGVATDFTAEMVNRVLYVIGATESYSISAVDTVNQTLTLASNYQGPTDQFAVYAIRPDPGERRLVYFSGAGEPESWLATDAISVQETGDEISGLMQYSSFLYIIEKRHLHKLTFQDNPGTDGRVYMSAKRGCINNRCWVGVDNSVYMLDEYGVHKFQGSFETESVSDSIQELFRPGTSSRIRINWQAQKWFHAVLYRPQETIRWFVALSGQARPQTALCFNYRLNRWWVESFPIRLGASCAGRINLLPYVFLGGLHRKVYAMWQGFTDMADVAGGTLRGNVTGATQWGLTDSSASFGSGFANAPVVIVSGRGKGQRRHISSSSGNTLAIRDPWLVLPDSTSRYQIGGVSWFFRSAWMRFADNENFVDRRLEIQFEPTEQPATMDLRQYFNFSAEATEQGVNKTSAAGNNIAATAGNTDLVIDLADEAKNGFTQQRIPGHRETFIMGKRFLQLELAGVTNQDPQTVYSIIVEGVEK